MPYRRPPRVAARLALARERAVTVALDLVADRGWPAASVTAIAAAAGMSAGALYRHFPSKAELLVEVFRKAASRELSILEALTRPGAVVTAGSADMLRQAVSLFARRALDGPVLAFALLAEPADPAVEAERLIYRRRFREVFATIVSAGVARGELPPQDPELTAAAVVGAISEVLVGPLSHPRERGPAPDLVAQTCLLALRCAGGGPGSVRRQGAAASHNRTWEGL